MVTLNDRTWCTETPVVDDRAARRAQFEREALVHLDALYSFALKLARARDDAQDLVSDTLLRAFERWEQYHLGTNIRAWLFTILYHVFVSRKRRIDAREVRVDAIRGTVTDLPRDVARNTGARAVDAMRRALDLSFGIALEIDKGIALGSGMGGRTRVSAGRSVAAPPNGRSRRTPSN